MCVYNAQLWLINKNKPSLTLARPRGPVNLRGQGRQEVSKICHWANSRVHPSYTRYPQVQPSPPAPPLPSPVGRGRPGDRKCRRVGGVCVVDLGTDHPPEQAQWGSARRVASWVLTSGVLCGMGMCNFLPGEPANLSVFWASPPLILEVCDDLLSPEPGKTLATWCLKTWWDFPLGFSAWRLGANCEPFQPQFLWMRSTLSRTFLEARVKLEWHQTFEKTS